MKKKYHIIQIIPSDSGKTVSFKIRSFVWRLLGIFAVLFFGLGILFICKLSTIDAIILSFRQVQRQNEMLQEKQREYELFFSELDSISTMERQIKKILETFYETDSTKLSAIIEKNRFHFTPLSQNHLNAEYRSGVDIERKNWDSFPNIVPTIGIISKEFSMEENHLGIDISAKLNEPVFSTAEGKVISVSKAKDLGLHIQIDHGKGYTTRYSHLQKASVKKGAKVKKGEVIGTVGTSGNSTGSHIHYEILKDNQPIDPELFIEEYAWQRKQTTNSPK